MTFLSDAALHHAAQSVDKVRSARPPGIAAAERERRRDRARPARSSRSSPTLGLSSARSRAAPADNSAQTADDLRGRCNSPTRAPTSLRRMLAGQRATEPTGSSSPNRSAVSRNIREHFDIEFRFDAEPGVRVSDRLAADLLAMIGEGLSNIRRHTTSRWAKLCIFRDGEDIRLTLENERSAGDTTTFIPKSIRDRAQGLGGDARVEHAVTGDTIVHVRIPL